MTDDLPPTFGPEQRPTAADLVPGATILRWTDNRPNLRLRAPLPCHGDQTVETIRGAVGVTVICRTCNTAYRLDTIDDRDGGFTAHYTVSTEQFQLSRARPMS